MVPLWFSRYVLHLQTPHVSLTIENISDFLAAYLIGNLMQMAFRFWAFRRWVFPDQLGDDPDRALESTLTAGGIAEALEDEIEARETRRAVVTQLRRPRTPPAA
jgi:hypothetical protein